MRTPAAQKLCLDKAAPLFKLFSSLLPSPWACQHPVTHSHPPLEPRLGRAVRQSRDVGPVLTVTVTYVGAVPSLLTSDVAEWLDACQRIHLPASWLPEFYSQLSGGQNIKVKIALPSLLPWPHAFLVTSRRSDASSLSKQQNSMQGQRKRGDSGPRSTLAL